jgi:Domain of unknown function (DUF5666)
MKNLKYIILFLLIASFAFFIVHLPLALAQTPATDSSSGLRDSVRQKVAEELAQIKQAVSKKAYLGSITAKADAALTLTNYANLTRSVVVSTDATIKLKNGREGTLADLKVNDYLLVLGDVDSAGTMTAKRILVVNVPPADKRVVVYGIITKTTSSSITVTTPKNENLTIKMTSATKYTGKTKLTGLKADDRVLVITSSNTALILHVMTPASPSASPTP